MPVGIGVGTGSVGSMWYPQIDVVSQSQATNTSVVRVRGTIYNNSTIASFNNNNISKSVSGTASWSTASPVSVPAKSWQDFIDVQFTVTHDANGYCHVDFTVAFGATGTAGLGGPTSASMGYDLPRIPKAPDPPFTYYDGLGPTAVHIYLGEPADNHGATVDGYETYLLANNAWPGAGGVIVASIGSYSLYASAINKATTYFYTARARNIAGWSGWTTMQAVTTPASVPDAPAMPALGLPGPDGCQVSWSPPNNGGSPITSYDVQVATNLAFTAGVQTFLGVTSPHTLIGLLPATGYWVKVRANNAIGPSAFSSANSFTTLSGLKVKVNGQWANAKLWVKVGGVWVLAPKVWKKHDDVWSI